MSRRLNGNIENRGGGRYRLTVSGGTDHNGKRIRHRKTVEAKSDREAERELMLYLAQLEGSNFYEPETLRFKEFAEKWLEEHCKVNLSIKTCKDYEWMLNKRVYDAIGHMPMAKIKPLHIIEFEGNLRKDGARLDGKPGGLSEKTIMYHHRLLSSIFSTAVQWGVVKENPVQRIRAPKVRKKGMNVYNMENTAAMLEALKQEPLKWQVLVQLALVTGLRRGELLGLVWEDIDFENNTLDVNKASQSLAGHGTFTKDTKNYESERLISLPGSTMLLLKEFRKEWIENKLKLGDLWEGSERLWVSRYGGHMHTDTPTKWFPKFIKRHNLPHITFHGLRHTSATLLIHQGVNIRSVSGRLGHSRTSTTMDIYAHALKSADETAADIMEDILVNTK